MQAPSPLTDIVHFGVFQVDLKARELYKAGVKIKLQGQPFRVLALLVARAVWLGDPLAIPLHQLQSGSLLIFAFFMISDPRTTPDSRLGRLLFALGVAALAHYLAFFMQMRPALYVALIAFSPLTLLIDRIIPAKRFAWTPQGASR